MNITKAIKGMISTVALMAMAATAAMAQQTIFASATGAGSGANTVFTYTGGANGQFTTTGGSQFLATFLGSSVPVSTFPATLSFTDFRASSMATGSGTTADPFTQNLGSGTFTLTGGGGTLLTGSFGGGNILTAVAGASSTAGITTSVNNVTYTGGTYFTQSGLINPGSFSITMASVTPTPVVTGGYLSGFTAGGSAVFSATPRASTVPEPASLVPFALGGLGLLGLVARKTRRTSGMVA